MWRTTINLQLLAFLTLKRKSKVNKLNILGVLLHQDIVQFEISMSISAFMHIANGTDNLLENPTARLRVKSLIGQFFYMMVNWHSMTQFHDKMHLRSLVNNFVQAHDIGMPQIRKRVNFWLHSKLCFRILQIFLFISFDSNNSFCFFMNSSSDYSKSALTYF